MEVKQISDIETSSTASTSESDNDFDENVVTNDVDNVNNITRNDDINQNLIISSSCNHRIIDEKVRRGSIKPLLINIDARSHLEVADSKHRYSKNLRLYFQEYIRLHSDIEWEQYTQQIRHNNDNDNGNGNWQHFKHFFQWLDSSHLPEHPLCPRTLLDSDTVLYLTTFEQRKAFAYQICDDGLLRKYYDNNNCSSCNKGELLNTDGIGWIFVLKDKILYAHVKDTQHRPRFHHSTFLAGESVEAAGLLVCENGKLLKLFPHSGHYRPHDHHLLSMLEFFNQRGVSLNNMQVDAQRVLKVSRLQNTDGEKMKKINTTHMINGMTILYFLRNKEKFTQTANLICSRLISSKANSPTTIDHFNDSLDSETSFYTQKDIQVDIDKLSPHDKFSSKKQRSLFLSSLIFDDKSPNLMKLNYPIDKNELDNLKIDNLKILLSDSPVAGV